MRRLILILTIFNSLIALSQTDRDFWFVAPDVSSGHGDYPIYFQLSTTDRESHVTISQPANPSFDTIRVFIPSNATKRINLSGRKSMIENKPADQVLNYGIHIEATEPVSGYYEMAHAWSAETFTLKGENALGNHFLISAQNVWPYSNTWIYPDPKRSFEIVATEDSTTVTIIPTEYIVGHFPYDTFSVILDKGQTYSACIGYVYSAGFLEGSEVFSDKPIAITLSNDAQHYESTDGESGWELMGDQAIPVRLLDTQYIAIEGYLEEEYVFIMATEDYTELYINGTFMGHIMAKETYPASFGLHNTDFMHIRTSAPVYAYHASGHENELCAAILPPANGCTGSLSVGFSRAQTPDDPPKSFFINLLVRNDYDGKDYFKLFINNTEVANAIRGSDFTTVPGTNWAAAQIDLTNTVPEDMQCQVINTSDYFHMGILYGYNASMRYGYFSDFDAATIDARVVSETDTAVGCVGDSIQLTAKDGIGFTWWPGKYLSDTTIINPVAYFPKEDSVLYHVVIEGRCGLIDTVEYLFKAVNPVSNLIPKDTTICYGEKVPVLHFENSINDNYYSWYADAGISLPLQEDGPAEYRPDDSTAGSYTYYVYEELPEKGCNHSLDSIQMDIIEVPKPSIVPAGLIVCEDETNIPFSAYSDYQVNWYEGDSLKNNIFTGYKFYPNDSLVGNYDYWVLQKDTIYGCISEAVKVNYSIKDIPPPPQTDTSISTCYKDTCTLSASGELAAMFKWYAGKDLQTLLHIGQDFALPDTFSPMTHDLYVTQMVYCESEPTRIGLEVKPLPAATIEEPGAVIDCYIDTVELTGNGTGALYWYTPDGAIHSGDTTSTPLVTQKGHYILKVTGANGCFNYDTLYLPEERPDAGNGSLAELCNTGIYPLDSALTGNSPGGNWYNMANEQQVEKIFDFSGMPGGTYDFKYKIDKIGEYCDSSEAIVTITLYEYKSAGNGLTASICNTDTINLFNYLQGYDNNGYWLDITEPETNALHDSLFYATEVNGRKYLFSYNIKGEAVCPDDTETITLTGDMQAPVLDCGGNFFERDSRILHTDYEVMPGEFIPHITDNCSKITKYWNSFNNDTTLTGAIIPDNTTITWYATDYAGNTGKCSFLLNIIPFTVRNYFSPNGDGYFDTWDFKINNVFPEAIIYVYNRWSEPVFVSDRGYHEKWDGTANGRKLPAGSYHYVIKNKGEVIKKGFVTIMY